ncbi:MAG: type II secretion system F family protein [Candidatus Dormibacteraceae bacterium]
MVNLLPAAIAALAGAVWMIGLWYLGAYTPAPVLTWRRLAKLRGLNVERSWSDRLGGRLWLLQRLLERLQQQTDVAHMLFVAGRSETTSAWFLRQGFIAGSICVVFLLIDALGILLNGQLSYPVGIAFLAGVLWGGYSYIRLRNQAGRRQTLLNRAITDSLVHLAAMTFHQRIPAPEALLIFARCQPDRELYRLLQRPEAQFAVQAAEGPLPAEGTAAIYDRLGEAYGVSMFHSLASAMRRVTERGLSSRDVFTQLARTTYGDLLAESRVQAAQTKTLIVIPMGLMIIPLLALIGAPLVASMGALFGQ